MSILEWFWPKPLPWDVLLKETLENDRGVRLTFARAFKRDDRWFVEECGRVIELLRGGTTVGHWTSSTLTWENIDRRSMGI